MSEMSARHVRILFYETVANGIKHVEAKNQRADIPLRRESWIRFIDDLVKSGELSEEKAKDITAPGWVNGN